MAKIVITLDTEEETVECNVDGTMYDAKEIMVYKRDKSGFDMNIRLAEEKMSDVCKYTSLVCYCSQKLDVKSYANIKFLNDKNTFAKVETKKVSEKLTDWIRDNLK